MKFLAFLPTRFHGESTVMNTRKKSEVDYIETVGLKSRSDFDGISSNKSYQHNGKTKKKLVVLILLSLIANSETCVTNVLSPNWFTSSNLFQSSKALLLGFSL